MAILSEYEEEDQKKGKRSVQERFLVNDVNAVVRMVKDKVETEDKKRKEVKIEGNGKAEKKIKEEAAPVPVKKAEKKIKEEVAPLPVKKEEMKKQEVKEVKEEKGSGSEVDGENNGRRAPNKHNGLDMEKYSWGQSLSEVTITVPVPAGTKSRFITCEIKKNHVKVGLKGQPPVIDGELFQPVKVDDCFWSLEDQKSISILLTKQNQMEWWKYLVKGEPEVDTQKVEPENSRLADLDPETRSTFDQRQKQMGRPTSDEMQKQEILKKFMAEHPEMDFSRAKIN
ncbi:hypothetical protein DH2020_048549 [Rehmannia glutinosa]|uniref:CS domain-containing protein n=1 Tax=Rehmannia glutinosa TaxID=99300 RepID=A0ABR0U5A6_REHGL